MNLSRRTKIGVGVAVASAFALVVTGCASGSGSSTPSDAPVTLTLATFNNFGYTDELLASYHKLHPNVTITQKIAKTSDEAQTNLFTKLAAGSGLSDVEAVDGDWMPKVAQYPQLFVDLASADNKGRYAAYKTEGGTVNGKLIGLGTDTGPEAICYRADLLKKAGLPSDPAGVATLLTGDWNTYYAAGEKFVKANPGVGWFDSAGATYQGLANQYKNFFEKDDGTVIATTNPDVKNAFDSVLTASKTLSAHLQEWTDDWSGGMAKGKFATMLCPPWMMGVIQGDSPKVTDWNIADVFPNGGGNWGGSYLLVPTHTRARGPGGRAPRRSVPGSGPGFSRASSRRRPTRRCRARPTRSSTTLRSASCSRAVLLRSPTPAWSPSRESSTGRSWEPSRTASPGSSRASSRSTHPGSRSSRTSTPWANHQRGPGRRCRSR